MTGRATEVRAMTRRRGESIPPPPRDSATPTDEAQMPAVKPAPDTDGGSDRPNAVTYIQPPSPVAQQPAGATASRRPRPEAPTLERLFGDVVTASRDMAYYREAMPVRALNINITAGVRAAFERHCKDLRVNMKDVVEMLLRGWLNSEDVDVQDIWPDR